MYIFFVSYSFVLIIVNGVIPYVLIVEKMLLSSVSPEFYKLSLSIFRPCGIYFYFDLVDNFSELSGVYTYYKTAKLFNFVIQLNDLDLCRLKLLLSNNTYINNKKIYKHDMHSQRKAIRFYICYIIECI